jgi:Tol biopolymer transport system component
VRLGLVAIVALAVALTLPAGASAFYGEGAQIVSADFERLEQGDDATFYAAISADGRYVAIQTRARNFFADDDPDPPGQYRAGGIFRFDLATKALEKVADGDLFDEETNEFVRLGASNPSISADGRYIAFVTAEKLLPSDINDNLDVYVRDMTVAVGGTGGFDLVSARDGGDVPASYGEPAFPFPGSEPGSDVSAGVAISADGQRVVFQTEVPSDLPASGAVDVPAGQVFLRDRVAESTTLVTAQRDSESEAMTQSPAGGALGAGISGDGSTVVWTGGNAAAQTRFLNGEGKDPSLPYYLWRRIGDGPGALTRRITGVSDPDDPLCPPEQTSVFNRTNTGPCFGPLGAPEGLLTDITSQVPAVSADGSKVAFLTGAPPRPLIATSSGLDLFITDMSTSLTRKQATVELTRDTVGTELATDGPLSSVAMSADGSHLAITTSRTRFVFPALQQLDSPRSVPGPQELYEIDLVGRTVERVTRAYWGGDIDADVLAQPTLSADGARIAFAAFAGSLFFGDANSTSDAFVAERQPEAGSDQPLPPAGAGGPDGTIEESSGPQIAVRAMARSGGVVLLTVSVPAAGGVRAVAKAGAGRPRKQRTLAAAKGRAKGTKRTTIRLKLRPVRRYRSELRARGRIRGRAIVTYVASRGGRRAAATRRIVFRQHLGGSRPGGRR